MNLRKYIFRIFLLNTLLLLCIGFAGFVSTFTLRNIARTENPEAYTHSEFQKVFRWTGLANSLLLGAGILGSFWMGLRLTRKLSHSLEEINAMASTVASGDLSAHLPEMGLIELDELADSLNRLVNNLAQADKEITREVEERVYAEKKALEAASAKSAFLAQVSHEFRTPLNGILGYTQVLMMDKGLSEKNLGVVESLRRSGESLLELVNDVLDLSKIEARSMHIKQSRFYLADMLQSLAGAYADQVRLKGLDFRMKLDDHLPEDILGDQVRIRQILVNLISNAVKFTDSGFIELRVDAADDGIHFEIEDSGVGISEKHLQRIFEPFVQVGRSRVGKDQGTGLGLSICNRLLEIMGSTLEIRSTPGKGSVFHFVLPQPEREGRRLIVPAGKVTGYAGGKRNLILLDPGRENASVLCPLLRQTGFGVLDTEDKETALSGCDRMKPDAILITHCPPKLDGIQFLEQLLDTYARNESPPPPVFILSAHHQASARNAALSAGAADVLTSPVRFQDLLNLFAKHLNLEWVTGERAKSRERAREAFDLEDIQAPPASMLRHCLFLARAGNVRKIKETIEDLQQHNPEYNFFSQFVLDHCVNYQMSPLVDWLEQRLISDNENTHVH
ncbi:MAG: response regulator [Verrucomicrobia bacterium]|nr:response regulator [Verrucomicrobiota bacterium]MCH8513681.1 response regulator [Kiritimatiellia bacterium]